MDVTPSRVLELVRNAPWPNGGGLRIFWVCLSEGGRDEFAQVLAQGTTEDPIVPIVIRESLFLTANALLSDVNYLIERNRNGFAKVVKADIRRLTIVLLAKEELRLPQLSSPITLPRWFPIAGGCETFIRLSDLFQQSEVSLLNCPEARIEDISERLVALENAIAEHVESVWKVTPDRLGDFWMMLFGTRMNPVDAKKAIEGFVDHARGIPEPRAYRPNASKGPSVVSRMIRLVLTGSPEQIAAHAKLFAVTLDRTDSEVSLRPSMFAVLCRPLNPLPAAARNWHSMLMSIYQAYQLMNGAAHAGEYSGYPVSLIAATSIDVRRALQEAVVYVEDLRSRSP